MGWVIEAGGPSARTEIAGLLEAARLPLDGLDQALGLAVVARAPEGLVGCAAVEAYGRNGLLRSVAVAPDLRGRGLGRELVDAAEAAAVERGIDALYLLTETAASWFPRLGYEVVERAAVPAEVATSVEFVSACPVSAVAMRKRLSPR